jgi:predicted DNA-binding transcriptional regulator AlpA
MREQFLLTTKDAAEACGCSERSWRAWNAAAFVPFPIQIGRSLFWSAKELEQWIDAGCPKRKEWEILKKC